MTPTEIVKPSTSLNWAMGIESTSTWKAYTASGSSPIIWFSSCALKARLAQKFVRGSFGDGRNSGGQLGKSEDDELSGFDSSNADFTHDLPRLYDLGRVRLVITLDVEGFSGARAEQSAIEPDAVKERGDGSLHPLPEVAVIGLEHHPLCAAKDRGLDVVEEPTYVDVAPGRIARQRT